MVKDIYYYKVILTSRYKYNNFDIVIEDDKM